MPISPNAVDYAYDGELDDLEDKTLPLHTLDDLSRENDPLAEQGDTPAAVTAAPPPPSNKKHATAYLDGLRGLAALLVYIYHHISWFYGPTDDLINGYGANGNYYFFQLPFVRILLSGGNAGVHIFFVLSGFVLSVSSLRSLRDGHIRKCYTSLMSSLVRRPFRLYLPVVGVTFAFAVSLHLPFGLAPALGWPQVEDSLLLELRRWVMETFKALLPSTRPDVLSPWYIYNPPVYTIPVELVGSVLVFLMLALSAKLTPGLRAALYGLIGLALLFSYYGWAMACFMSGMVLAVNETSGLEQRLASLQIHRKIQTTVHYWAFFFGWFLLCQPAGMRDIQGSYDTPGFYFLTALIPSNFYDIDSKEFWRWWHSWGAFLVVYGLLKLHWAQRLFSSRPLKYLGKISFCFYLVHGPLLWTLSDRVYRFFGRTTAPELKTMWDDMFPIPDIGVHGVTTRFLISQAVILPMNFFFGHIGTIILDEPSVRFGRWLVAKLHIGNTPR
jgi:peptidoglycan/LPS O-acetylase OafA/YrhL